MAYAAASDLNQRFGEAEILDLASTDEGTLDEGKVNLVLEDASAIINSYISKRYDLPLSQVPAGVVAACCDIARYNLYAVSATEEVTTRYKNQINWLKDVAKGLADIGITDRADSYSNTLTTTKSAPRTFSASSMRGFMCE